MKTGGLLQRWLLGIGIMLTTFFASYAGNSFTTDSLQAVEKRWLFGIGCANVLDTYLSPAEYIGPSFGLHRRSERMVGWGNGRISRQTAMDAYLSVLEVESDADRAWDGQWNASIGWHYNLYPVRGMRLALGALAQGGLGFTYMLKGGNNPAQGRLAANVALSVLAEQVFWRKWMARLQLDAPLLGAMFSPNYGQSYYEIFSLRHYDHNVCLTHPGNAPSLRCEAVVEIPIRRARICVGYVGDIRQSQVNSLKQHGWNHSFVIGYNHRIFVEKKK